ncbi:BTAD domain-containing putative transcriptional regulator [Saccharomonospora sp. NPDC006951]
MTDRMSGFVVQVLGPLRLRRRGGDVAINDSRLIPVLACLVVHANTPVPVDTLIEAGWGGDPPAHARDALESRLSRLRTLLAGDGDVSWEGQNCVLRVEPRRIDAVRFERLVAAASRSRPQRAMTLLTRALALWRAPAYPELVREGLAHPQALRLGELRLEAIETLAMHELSAGQPESAIARLLDVLTAEPFRQRTTALLMRVYRVLGRDEEAAMAYESMRERLDSALHTEPSAELRSLSRGLLAMPHSPGSLTGRQRECDRLLTMADNERLVTVTGQGGVGKTRLLREILPRFTDPAVLVELCTVDSEGVVLAVAAALGVHAPGSVTALVAAIADELATRRTVLVLDNCEHVLDAVRELLTTVLSETTVSTVLATSRVPLGLGGERVMPLTGLETWDEVRALLMRRAHAIRPGFAVTDSQLDRIREWLRTVEGLPLGIELAAARIATEGLDDLPPLPKDVVTWSVERLDDQERESLAALAVFHGEFDGAAAEAVTGSDTAVTGLARTGLLGGQDARYRAPELVRQVAARGLRGSHQEGKVRDRHARWCLDLVTSAVAAANGKDELAATASILGAAKDIVGALSWASHEEPILAANLGGRTGLLFPHRSEVDIHAAQWRLAWQEHPGLSAHALLLGAGAKAALRFGAAAEALSLAEKAYGAAESAEESYLALSTIALSYRDLSRPEQAERSCLGILELEGLAPACLAEATATLSLLATTRGDTEEAGARANAARALAETAGAPSRLAFARYAQGEAEVARDLSAGAAILLEARAEAKSAQASLVLGPATTTLAAALVRLGRQAEAAALLPEAIAHWERLGSQPWQRVTSRIGDELRALTGR